MNWPAFWTDEAVVEKILYRARDRRLYETTRDELRAILAEQLGVPVGDTGAIAGWSAMQMLNSLRLDRTRGLMLIIAVTTLLIGGIGVLNMMLDSVHERRQESGVRLALGARRRDVLMQFFLESFAVCLVGGGVGLGLGVAGCAMLAALEMPDLVPVPILSTGLLVTAVSVMTAVGLLAGFLPALRAMRVDPATTLRME
jgi:putative ABC transport system permease protein